MFKKSCLLFLATLLCASSFQSCDREESMMSDQLQLRVPYREWKFDGFATRSTEAGYINNKQSYSLEKFEATALLFLNLQQDGTFSGNTPANQINGNFTFDLSRGTLSFLTIESSGFTEQSGGTRYLACLTSVASYAVFEKTLHLYYTKDKTHFLLFSAVK